MSKLACVFGSYLPLAGEALDVVGLGRGLARLGFTVVSGGFDGTMEQVSRGAKEAGGRTIGVTCYVFPRMKYPGANRFIDEEIVTNTLFERIQAMIEISDLFICLPGGTGTLLEMAAVIEHVNKGLCEPKPLYCIGEHWKGVAMAVAHRELTCQAAISVSTGSTCDGLFQFVDGVEELLEKLRSL